MKIKAVAKELKNADVRFISLVKRGANRIPFRILKTDSKEGTQMIDLANLSPVLKGEKTRIVTREENVLKAVNTRSFAQILGASVSRDIGTPPPPVKIAPAPIAAKPIASIQDTPVGVGKPLPRAFNTPKQPTAIPSKGNPVEFASLRAAIDTALHEQRQREQSERFNAGRSAFSRIHKSTAPDAPSGTGSAWSLRNASGKLVQSVLGGVSRKAETSLPTNTAFRPFSASHKG